MKQLYINTPRVKEWKFFVVFSFLSHLRLGVNLHITPFAGQEFSDLSAWLNLPWCEVGLGFDNNPW